MSDLRLLPRLLVAAALACGAAPATAAADPVPRTVTQTAMTQPLPSSGSGANHALECAAVGTGDVISVEITACYLRGADGRLYRASGPAHPGPVSARVGAFLEVPLQRYVACVSTRWTHLDGSTGEATTCFG